MSLCEKCKRSLEKAPHIGFQTKVALSLCKEVTGFEIEVFYEIRDRNEWDNSKILTELTFMMEPFQTKLEKIVENMDVENKGMSVSSMLNFIVRRRTAIYEQLNWFVRTKGV